MRDTFFHGEFYPITVYRFIKPQQLMSAEGASMAVKMFAPNTLTNQTQDHKIMDHYYALRDFVAEGSENSKIFRQVD